MPKGSTLTKRADLLYAPKVVEVGSGLIRSVGMIILVKRTETALTEC